MKYRKIRLNPQVLATMFIGFQRKLFTTPKENDILFVEEAGGNCVMFFEKEFWNMFLAELNGAYRNGKFANSNANADWMILLNTIQSAKESETPKDYKDYYTELKMFL